MTLLASLRRIDDTTGSVRIEDVYDTDIDDLWNACTEPERLARWIAVVPVGIEQGTQFDADFTSGFEGTCRIDVCERPNRLVVTTRDRETGAASTIEAHLDSCAGGTRLVIEETGVPAEQLAGYGAGWHVHAEDLTAHLAGKQRDSAPARWTDMAARYRQVEIDRAGDAPAISR